MNLAIVNEDPNDKLIRDLREEVFAPETRNAEAQASRDSDPGTKNQKQNQKRKPDLPKKPATPAKPSTFRRLRVEGPGRGVFLMRAMSSGPLGEFFNRELYQTVQFPIREQLLRSIAKQFQEGSY